MKQSFVDNKKAKYRENLNILQQASPLKTNNSNTI